LSPILVRPVREQLEHDRVIRLLQQDLQKRKVEVGINPGFEQNAGVGSGTRKEYPDAVIYSLEKGKKVVAVLEVETGESVNHLEAMAQWAHLAKLRVPFHLYVPTGSVDVARRLSADYHIAVTEIWSYHQVGEQFKFTLIHPTSGRHRSASAAPRTVSVSTIRVPLPDPDAFVKSGEPAEEPPARTHDPARAPAAVAGGKAAGPRVIPAKGSAKPVPAAPTPKVASARPPARGASAAPAAVPSPAPVVRKMARTTGSAKAAAPARPAVKPASKAVARTAKTAARTGAKARAALPRATRPKPAAKAARAARAAKPARKPAGRRK
jgi:hypothetical protein